MRAEIIGFNNPLLLARPMPQRHFDHHGGGEPHIRRVRCQRAPEIMEPPWLEPFAEFFVQPRLAFAPATKGTMLGLAEHIRLLRLSLYSFEDLQSGRGKKNPMLATVFHPRGRNADLAL